MPTLMVSFPDCPLLRPPLRLLRVLQADLPVPKRLHRVTAELHASARRGPEPQAGRAAGGQALPEE